MTPEEQETTIVYDKAQQLVRIFSAWPKDQRKIERAGIKPVKGDPETGLFYEIPLARLFWKVRKPRVSKDPAQIAVARAVSGVK